jgi:hypothetical protein
MLDLIKLVIYFQVRFPDTWDYFQVLSDVVPTSLKLQQQLDELAIEFASATTIVAAFETPAAVCGRGTNAASPIIQTLTNTILGTDKSYIVCMKGSWFVRRAAQRL